MKKKELEKIYKNFGIRKMTDDNNNNRVRRVYHNETIVEDIDPDTGYTT